MEKDVNYKIDNISPDVWAVTAARAQETLRGSAHLVDSIAVDFLRVARSMVPDDYFEHMGVSLEPRDESGRSSLHTEVRFRFFDEYVEMAKSDSIRQVVILGAGFDTRAFRMEWPEGAVVYEIDLPDVINFKELVISEMGVVPKCSRKALATDLRGDWSRVLFENGFDDRKPTAWMAEGLVHALTRSEQRETLRQISRMSARGSYVAFQYFEEFTSNLEKAIRNNHYDIVKEVTSNRWLASTLGYNSDSVTPDDLIAEIKRRVASADDTPEFIYELGWQTAVYDFVSLAKRYYSAEPEPEVVETIFVSAKFGTVSTD